MEGVGVNWQTIVYIVPILAAGIIPLILLIYALKYRKNSPLLGAFIFVMAALTIWSFGYVLELYCSSLSVTLLMVKIEYIGIVTLPVAWLIFALQYTGREKWISIRNLALLFIIPIFELMICWTNYRHLFYKNVELATGVVTPIQPSYGPAFWLLIIYCQILTLVGVFLFLRKSIELGRLYLKQGIILAAGVMAPIIGNAVYVTGLSPLPPGYDLTPLLFTVTGIVLIWVIFRFRFLDIVPVARNAIFENISDAIFVLDKQNRIIDFNRSGKIFVENAIHHPSEIIGECVEKMLHPDILPKFDNDKTQISIEIERNGRHYDVRISPIYDKRKQILGRIIILRDITDRKKAEEALKESEKRFEDIARSSADWIWEVDKDGKYTFVSGKVKDILGYHPEELIGKTPFDLMPKEEATRIRRIFKEISSKKKRIIDLENWNLSKKGEKICLLTNGVPILDRNDNLLGYRGVDKNITERKKAEERIKQLNETLKLLNKIMRHDILNNLQIIQSSLEFYAEEGNKDLLETMFKRIQSSIELIHKMSALESLVSSSEKLKEYNVIELVEDVIKDYSVDFKIEGNGIIIADEAIRSVIDNIISNAIVHGKTDKIDINIENKGDTCEIRITDYGRGIPDEIKEKVFEEHFSYGETGGTGLGLYIVKQTIERYGGSIHIEDNKPKGTVFVIRLKGKK